MTESDRPGERSTFLHCWTWRVSSENAHLNESRFNATLIKILTKFFIEITNVCSTSYGNTHSHMHIHILMRTHNQATNPFLNNIRTARGISIPDFKLY